MRKRIFKWVYDRLEPGERAALAPYRERLVGDLEGRVLEIGCGQGASFGHYRAGTEVVATDYSELMLDDARREADRHPASFVVRTADVLDLPFEDGEFDAVVSMLVLCSVGDQKKALSEIRRVLKPGGSLRALEHVRSQRWWRFWLQRSIVPIMWLFDGERFDRATDVAIRDAGFTVDVQEEPHIPELASIRRVLIFARK